MMPIRILRVALLTAVVAGLTAAGTWSIRLACADARFRTETVAATRQALSLTPGQAEYHVRLAQLLSEDDPVAAVAALRRAVSLNPHDAQAWIELGLRSEATGDLPRAEANLLRAAAESRLYLPRWTLMNYYFRRRDSERFWFWAKSAVPMIWGDPLPLFQLCGRVTEAGDLIDRLRIRQPELQAAYLFYLLDRGRPDLVGPSGRRLLQAHRATDVPLLLQACDRLLAARRPAEARSIWDGLIAARRIPAAGETGASPTLLYNGDFSVSPSDHGFDWRLPLPDGISAAREEHPDGLRLTFSGSQPESSEPLVEWVPVEERTLYELRFDYLTSGIPVSSGLVWRIADAAGGAVIASGDILASEQPAARRLYFTTPPECRLMRLSLAYQRRPGTTRIAGFLILRHVILGSGTLPAANQLPSGGPPRSRVMK
jgi:tetratricopeptide (TPR) repeat protein